MRRILAAALCLSFASSTAQAATDDVAVSEAGIVSRTPSTPGREALGSKFWLDFPLALTARPGAGLHGVTVEPVPSVRLGMAWPAAFFRVGGDLRLGPALSGGGSNVLFRTSDALVVSVTRQMIQTEARGVIELPIESGAVAFAPYAFAGAQGGVGVVSRQVSRSSSATPIFDLAGRAGAGLAVYVGAILVRLDAGTGLTSARTLESCGSASLGLAF